MKRSWLTFLLFLAMIGTCSVLPKGDLGERITDSIKRRQQQMEKYCKEIATDGR